MITLYLLQIFVPLGLILWIAFCGARNLLCFCCEVSAALLLQLTLLLTGMWLITPWWTPVLLASLTLPALFIALIRTPKFDALLPARRWNWVRAFGFLVITLLCLSHLVPALKGRISPADTIALHYPLEPGSYLIVSGGNDGTINSHFLTLNENEPRFRQWRGQSYALDIVGINDWGFRGRGILPEDPDSYFIYGKEVRAPCRGIVKSVVNDVVDNRVPQMNRDSMSGNQVILNCEGVEVLLAHMIPNSIRVAELESVATGEYLGRVGNSGNSGEPHLHIHVQRATPPANNLDTDPLPFKIAGKYWVRNQIMRVPE